MTRKREPPTKPLAQERESLYRQMQAALAQAEAYAQRLHLLNEMSQQINLAEREAAIFQIATEYVRRILNPDQFTLVLTGPEADSLTVVVHEGSGTFLQIGQRIPIQGTVTGRAVLTGQAVKLDSFAGVDEYYAQAMRNAGLQSVLAAPLLVGSRAIGAFAFGSQAAHAYQAQDETLLSHITTFLAVAIDNIRRIEAQTALHAQTQAALAETEAYAQRLTWLNEMSQQLNLATTEAAVYQIASAYIERILYCNDFYIMLSQPEADYLEVVAAQGHTPILQVGHRVPLEGTFTGEAVRGRQLLNIGKLAAVHPAYAQAVRDRGIQALIIVPILVNQQPLGAIIANSQVANAFDTHDEQLMLHIASFLGIVIENIRHKQQLHAAMHLAETANRAKSDFLATMSHELRTPLNAILGYVQILGRDPALTARQRDGLDIIQHSGEHLLTLINDILDLSKIEAQRMELSPAPFHLSAMLKGLCDLMIVRAREKSLHFHYEALSDLPAGVYGDEVRLRQVLLNLLGNAVKYTNAGGIILKVGYHDERLRFQVEDSGIGIAPEALALIFQPFTQAQARRAYVEGTGLGLAISHHLVTLMGGTLRVKSTPGEGSTFWFDLALPAVEDFAGTLHVPEKRLIGYEGPMRRVLVVDDKWENRAVLVNMLRPLGFDVLEAVDGEDCLAKLPAFEPHAVLMDLRMPRLGGLEAIRHLRQLPQGQNLVLIAISASAFEYNRQESLAAGADDFLAKPFRLERLTELLATHLKLTWIIQEPAPATSAQAAAPLVVPPGEVLDTLLDLARQGDIRGLRDQAAHLARNGYPAFAAELQALAQHFRLNEIRQFLQQHRGEHHEHR